MRQNLASLFGLRDLRACPLIAAQLILAQRLYMLFERAGRDPLPDLAVRLHSMSAAHAVATLSRTVMQDWPENFLLRRPCCPQMSPDEALLAEITLAAALGDRTAAHEAMRDMLPHKARERLFDAALAAVATISEAQAEAARHDNG